MRYFVLLILILSALNWGLFGFFQYDLIADLCKSNASALARTIYGSIGVIGIYGLTLLFGRKF